MSGNRYGLVGFLALVVGLTGCEQRDNLTSSCKVVDKITPQSECYDPNQGLTLTASGHNQAKGQFTWYIYPQSDTSSTNRNIAKSLEKLIIGGERITVPDSLLKKSPSFVVKAVINCEGTELNSIHYSLVRRQSAGFSLLDMASAEAVSQITPDLSFATKQLF